MSGRENSDSELNEEQRLKKKQDEEATKKEADPVMPDEPVLPELPDPESTIEGDTNPYTFCKLQEDFDVKIKESKNLLMIFIASWCPPCQKIEPEIKDIKQYTRNQDVTFAYVDVDESADVCQKQEVMAMPTIFFYQNGEKKREYIGSDIECVKTELALMMGQTPEMTIREILVIKDEIDRLTNEYEDGV